MADATDAATSATGSALALKALLRKRLTADELGFYVGDVSHHDEGRRLFKLAMPHLPAMTGLLYSSTSLKTLILYDTDVDPDFPVRVWEQLPLAPQHCGDLTELAFVRQKLASLITQVAVGDPHVVITESIDALGTVGFVSADGQAVTALHVMFSDEELQQPPDDWQLRQAKVGPNQVPCRINAGANWTDDVALLVGPEDDPEALQRMASQAGWASATLHRSRWAPPGATNILFKGVSVSKNWRELDAEKLVFDVEKQLVSTLRIQLEANAYYTGTIRICKAGDLAQTIFTNGIFVPMRHDQSVAGDSGGALLVKSDKDEPFRVLGFLRGVLDANLADRDDMAMRVFTSASSPCFAGLQLSGHVPPVAVLRPEAPVTVCCTS